MASCAQLSENPQPSDGLTAPHLTTHESLHTDRTFWHDPDIQSELESYFKFKLLDHGSDGQPFEVPTRPSANINGLVVSVVTEHEC